MNPQTSFISEVITQFGPRRGGSEAEDKAQDYFRTRLDEFCHFTEKEPFEASLRAKFGALKVICLLYFVAIGLYWVSLPAALILSLVVAALFLLHFILGYTIMDVFYKKHTSSNVYGVIEPTGTAARTILFSGHMDSTPEFIWWYWFKGWAAKGNFINGILFALTPLLIVGAMAFEGGTRWAVFIILCFTGLLSIMFFFIHGKRVVDGAQDNLSGVSIALEAASRLKGKLKNTRIKVVSFGCEEGGLRGSSAFVGRHEATLKTENAVIINMDSVLLREKLIMLTAEPFSLIRYHKPTIERMSSAWDAVGIKPKTGVLTMGGTDGASFAKKGIPAVSIIGLPLGELHPTYHTRLDTVDQLDPVCLEDLTCALVAFAETWDKEE